MLLQQRDKFFLEGHLAMVLWLLLDVRDNLVELRHAHTEHSQP